MKRKLFFLVLILVSVLRPVAGQEPQPCFHQEIPSFFQNRGNCDNVESVDSAIIPVVFHIIHLGEPYGTGFNIHDSLVVKEITKMNRDFRNSVFGDDTKIRFVLATKDPDGNPTNGITRHDGSNLPKYPQGGSCPDTAFGTPGSLIKDLSFWDDTRFLNFWGVTKFYYGWGGTNSQYGLFIDMGQIGNPYATCTHETGHYFGLKHTFSGSVFVDGQYICPKNNDCSVDGDQICDTPPHNPYDYGLPCISGDKTNSTYNFMSYSSESYLFTTGQKEKMWDVLKNGRCGLISNAAVVSGIADIKSNKISVFPNPTNGRLYIQQTSEFNSEVILKVVNMFGAVVLEKLIPANQTNFEIDLSGMAKSVYLVNFSADGINTTEKIIIQ